MHGHKSHDVEVAVPAAVVWAALRGLGLINFVNKELPHLSSVEVLEGDGGVGTLFKVIFPPGGPINGHMIEKFTRMDDVNRVSEAEVIEGGYKDMGILSFHSKEEVVEKDSGSSIIRVSVEYEYDEKNAGAASHLSLQPLQSIVEAIAKHLEQK